MEGVSEHAGDFQLTIDGREPSSIFQAFNESKVPSTRKNLDVGDFEIALDNKPCIIVERKTWGDLVSSLTSNRLAEQTARIVEKCKVHGARPVLIVEHDRVFGWDGTSGGVTNKFVDCCLTKYAVEGFSVIRTKDVKHTRDVVKWLLERCKAGKAPRYSADLTTYRGDAGEQKFRKKDYGNAWEVMLTAVRGISKNKAKQISAKYKNAKQLIAFLESGQSLEMKGIGKKLQSDIKAALVGNVQ